MPLVDFSHRPTGWLRRALKAPTYIYRAHLGFVFGQRFLMVEHRGRRSGRRYFSVVEVAGRVGSEWVCTSGTGPSADWYQNVRAGGLDAVWLGSKRRQASVRFLTPHEAAVVMGAYERAHAKTAATLYTMTGVSYDGSEAGRVEMMALIPMVAFTLG
jgi:deazaflavin-dependent oxidoreductase (nitroreductase family)